MNQENQAAPTDIYPEESGTPERPVYRAFREQPEGATAFYGISVDEGWRSWILCTGMYQDKAEQLLVVLRASGVRWADQ